VPGAEQYQDALLIFLDQSRHVGGSVQDVRRMPRSRSRSHPTGRALDLH
jgi:hypothetical protein